MTENHLRVVNTQYLYDAGGKKLKTEYTAFHSKFQLETKKITEYLDNFQYENGILQFSANEEGYYDFVQNRYIYNYKDHLGNIRLSYYKQTDGTAKVLEENHYYPFGLRHTGYTPVLSNNTYRYKYNGKEVQENGMYDYGARMYMPEIARWGVMDPMAEQYRAWSPYNYAVNNPVSFIDPDGRLTYDWQLGAYRDGKGGLMGMSMNNWGDSSFGKGSTNDTSDRSAEIMSFISNALGNGAGGDSPAFQFPKGQEAYYQENYPAFFNFVKNQLPNMIQDKNFLQAFMDITGMSQEEVIQSFKYGEGAILHDWDVTHSMGQYDYSVTPIKSNLNSISISTEVMNWFQNTNRDTNSKDGVSNLLFMALLIGHEGSHWGYNIKGPTSAMNQFIDNFNGEHGNAFTYRVFKNDFKGVPPAPGSLGIGDITKGLPYNLKEYVNRHFNTLSKIFKP